ncbi:CatB-related O-acetyltransferase [Octadecabacter sp. G9-8]|uniref:CatB-related O-acetyltransferase n=1 Tax=Octadecabacter dasysiphoniae TaxID=2909341 RepID=A0ABS9D0E7_9RHOB|nr:CatB-related O-acetyltransferase [Octadecabacter dasysiphoniae]MCF2872991.1 CatB-related O-acetyltransferase [Octadecabacter dasysiphoniae]
MPPLPPRDFPTPDTTYPVILPDGTQYKGTVFLRAAIDNPNITVGDYTYASAHVPPADWAFHLAPYLFPQSPETLTIGKFCQIADGVTFITSSANHRYDGFSSFPFSIFLDMDRNRPSMPGAGPDTTIGHDVWIGQGATILPGANIGDGCIIGAKSVVSGTHPPYTILAGNPAKPVRRRFDDATIAALAKIAWWHWPIETVVSNEAAICGADLDALERAAPHA